MAETFVLPRKADISMTESSKASLLALLGQLGPGDTLALDGSRVDQVDSAFGQLVISLLKTCNAAGIKISYQGFDQRVFLCTAFSCDKLDPDVMELLK